MGLANFNGRESGSIFTFRPGRIIVPGLGTQCRVRRRKINGRLKISTEFGSWSGLVRNVSYDGEQQELGREVLRCVRRRQEHVA